MKNSQFLLNILCKLFSLLPKKFPGKYRIGRLLLSFFSNSNYFYLHGKNNLSYELPSISEPIALGIFINGFYEEETIDAILRYLPDDGVFVDIGANVGSISLPIAKIKPNSKVVSIEASNGIFQILQRNIKNNEIKNILSINAFVGEEDKLSTPFYEAPNQNFGMGSLGPQFNVEPIYILQRSLDSIFIDFKIPIPDVIKLDIEGAELLALRGAKKALSNSEKCPVIIFEFCDWSEARVTGQKPGDAQSLLMNLGYNIFDLNERKKFSDPINHGSSMLLAKNN